MIIRPVRHQDRDEILWLLEQTGVFNEKEILVALQVFEDATQKADKGEYLAFCASGESEHLLGYICFGPITVTDSCYDLYWIAVDKNIVRKQVGRTLLSFMEEYLAGMGARRVYVETSSTTAYEPARSFYEKNGYKLVCTLNDFYRSGDHRMVYMKDVQKGVSHWAEIECAGQDSRNN